MFSHDFLTKNGIVSPFDMDKIFSNAPEITLIYWSCAKKYTHLIPHVATWQDISKAARTLLEMSDMSQAVVTDITHHQGNTYALWAKS